MKKAEVLIKNDVIKYDYEEYSDFGDYLTLYNSKEGNISIAKSEIVYFKLDISEYDYKEIYHKIKGILNKYPLDNLEMYKKTVEDIKNIMKGGGKNE